MKSLGSHCNIGVSYLNAPVFAKSEGLSYRDGKASRSLDERRDRIAWILATREIIARYHFLCHMA